MHSYSPVQKEALRHRIRDVVNASDPMGLLLHAPDDEYDAEVNDILEAYMQTGPQLDELTKAIQAVFDRWFSPGDVPLARSSFLAKRLCEILPAVGDQQD